MWWSIFCWGGRIDTPFLEGWEVCVFPMKNGEEGPLGREDIRKNTVMGKVQEGSVRSICLEYRTYDRDKANRTFYSYSSSLLNPKTKGIIINISPSTCGSPPLCQLQSPHLYPLYINALNMKQYEDRCLITTTKNCLLCVPCHGFRD